MGENVAWKTYNQLTIEDLHHYAAASARGDNSHQGDRACFTQHVLEQPNGVVTLAEENWRVQREPRDALILLQAGLAAEQKQAP